MSLGLADRQAAARRRLIWAMLKWTLALALIALAGLFAYKTGTSLAELDTQRKNEEIARLSAEVDSLRTEITALRAAAARAEAEARQWEQRYNADVPTGDPKMLLDLAMRRLSEGAEMARLTYLINAAANPRVCDEKPEIKRVMVKTPIGKVGKDHTTSFADRKVTVTAEGESAVNQKGQKESWFDPGRPITVHFTNADGRTVDATGIVPLQHRMIAGGSEFRFAIDVDERPGFATVTSERCDFP
jgi:outer membrane murein-binding lipoprotein Lpp